MSALDASVSRSKEARLKLAVDSIKSGDQPTVAAAARCYDVSRFTLTARLRGRPSRQSVTANSRILSEEEEDVIAEKVLDLDSRGYPPSLLRIEQYANIIQNDKGKEAVGTNWAQRFVTRRPDLKTRWSRRMDRQRAKNEVPEDYENWFRLVHNMKQFHGIVDEDIYNFDETGFQIGQSGNQIVVTSSNRVHRPTIQGSDSTEWITIIACVSSRGFSLPPLIIFKGATINDAWFQGIPADWRIAVSDTGWTNDTIGLQWIAHFQEHTRSLSVGSKRLLVLDGHRSHTTPQFEQFCQDHNIITLSLPPHSSHRLQPLDVSCFGPLKRAYSKRMDQLFRVSYHKITKMDFLAEIQPAISAAFTESNVKAGFRGSGLIPLDPQAVLSKLTLRPETPTRPEAPYPWAAATPANQYEFDCQTAFIEAKLARSSTSPTEILAAVRQSNRGHNRTAAQLALMSAELAEVRETVDVLNQRATRKRKWHKVDGAVNSEELQRIQGQLAIERQLSKEMVIAEASSSGASRRTTTCSLCNTKGHNRSNCQFKGLIDRALAAATVEPTEP